MLCRRSRRTFRPASSLGSLSALAVSTSLKPSSAAVAASAASCSGSSLALVTWAWLHGVLRTRSLVCAKTISPIERWSMTCASFAGDMPEASRARSVRGTFMSTRSRANTSLLHVGRRPSPDRSLETALQHRQAVWLAGLSPTGPGNGDGANALLINTHDPVGADQTTKAICFKALKNLADIGYNHPESVAATEGSPVWSCSHAHTDNAAGLRFRRLPQ